MGKKLRKRQERLELRLTGDEKAIIESAANSLGLPSNQFVFQAVQKEVKRLKIKLKRPQLDLFAIEEPQLKLKL